MTSEMVPAIGTMIGCFSMAFLELAREHDAVQPAKTSVDILRELALRAEGMDDE